MSAEFTEHPGKDQLAAFGLGTLDPSEAEKIAEHVDSCPACGQTILSLEDDTFVSLVRNSPAPAAAANGQSRPGAVPPLSPQATVGIPSGVPDSPSELTELPCELREHPRYEILGLIGRGGMGEVYKAQHKVMNRIVALKVIKPQLVQNEAAVQRFHREVQAAARLSHPNIVAAYDAEQAGDLHYLVLEYVEGMDLAQLVRRSGPLPIAAACELVRQAALGLEHAHQNGLVHRDIKPSNLMLTADGTVKILDLGLALLEEASDEDARELTTAGQTMGTIDYMAPEQVSNCHEVDIRTDIYALGATLYKLLTGEAIYAGEDYSSPLQKLKALALTPAPAIQSRREDVPDALAAILDQMIAKDRDQRYATPGEVAEALAPFADQANVGDLLAAAHANIDELNQASSLKVPPSAGAVSRKGQSEVAAPIARNQSGSRSFHNHIVCLATGGGALFVLLAAIVFYIQTNVGAIRVEIDDPKIEVEIKGTDIVLKQADQGKDVRLSPGDHTLIVRREGLEFESKKLVLRRGDEVTVRVELLPGEVQVRRGEKLIGQHQLPLLAGDRRGPTAAPSTTLANGWVIGQPINLGPPINDASSVYSPWLSADGLTLLFGSNRPKGTGYPDLWSCTRPGVDQPWGEPVSLGPAVNSDVNDQYPCLSTDGLTLLFASDRRGGEGVRRGGEGVNDLWACSRRGVDQPWGKVVNLGPTVNSPHGEGAPFLSADGLVLLFHSNRPGGQGDSDLWMARRDRPDEEFDEPVNLGPTVNSSHKDRDPRLSHDGLTLLFSSDRPGGKGRFDLWMATRAGTEEPFGRAVNLGPTLNTAGSEMCPFLTADGQTLFFVAGARPGEQGGLAIYQASITAPTTLPNGWVIGHPVNLGPAVNSSEHDGQPWLSSDGLTLLFNRLRSGGFNVWMCTRSRIDEPWTDATNISRGLDWPFYQSPCLSTDGLTLLLTSERPGGQGKSDMWMYTRSSADQPWGKVANLGPTVNSPDHDLDPCLSADGLVLLFASKRPGGEGGYDLWMSRRDNVAQPFGEPVNLGPAVNAASDEEDPCLSADGLTLLFSSDRPGGQGGTDLWLSTRRGPDQPWGKPVNLGPGVNSPENEKRPCLSTDGRVLLFHSRRPGGQGESDIYQASIRAPRRPGDAPPMAVAPGANAQSRQEPGEARDRNVDDVEFTLLHRFDTDVAIKPRGRLVLDGDTLYGTADSVDPVASLIYSIKSDGSDPRILHRFTDGETRGWVCRELTLAGGRLYGTTNDDGDHKEGTVFAINADGSDFAVLHSFKHDPADGAWPRGKLVVQGTSLFGVTEFGGSGEDSEGTVYAMNTDGSRFRLLHSFEYEKGSGPANLWLNRDTLYGVSIEGGDYDVGVAFSIATDGTGFQVLHQFRDPTRWFDLAAYEDSVLAVGAGIVRRKPMDASSLLTLDIQTGRLRVLHEFSGGADDGDRLNDARLLGDTIFGTTDGGGPMHCGTVFSIRSDGSSFRLLHSFDEKTGIAPEGVMMDGSTLYGATPLHDGKERGTVYSLRLPRGPSNN